MGVNQFLSNMPYRFTTELFSYIPDSVTIIIIQGNRNERKWELLCSLSFSQSRWNSLLQLLPVGPLMLISISFAQLACMRETCAFVKGGEGGEFTLAFVQIPNKWFPMHRSMGFFCCCMIIEFFSLLSVPMTFDLHSRWYGHVCPIHLHRVWFDEPHNHLSSRKYCSREIISLVILFVLFCFEDLTDGYYIKSIGIFITRDFMFLSPLQWKRKVWSSLSDCDLLFR